MRDPLRNVSVRYKLALTFAGVCLLAFGVGGYIVSRTAREALEGEIHDRLRFQSRGIATALETELRALGQRARDFASDGYIRVQAEALLREEVANSGERARREADLRTHLVANKLAIVPAFVNLALSAAPGSEPFVALPDDRAWATGLPEDAFTETDWFSGLLAPSDADRAPTLALATPLSSLAGSRRLGSLLVRVDAGAWIGGALSGVRPGEPAGLLGGNPHPTLRLVDGAGRSLAIRGASPADWIYAEAGGAAPAAEPVARGVFVHRHPIAPAGPEAPRGWTLETVLDSRGALAAVAGLQARILIVGVALTAAACLLLFFPMRFLARPLRELQDAARAIRAGDFGARVHSESSDEVGELAHSFNLMAEAIEERAGRLQAAADALALRKDELRRERDRLDAVIRSMRDGLIVLDADGRPEVWNAAARPLLAVPDRLDMSSHRLCQSPHAIGANGATRTETDAEGSRTEACRRCLFDPTAPPRSCLVDVGASVFEVHATSLPPERGRADGRAGRVLVARDVTDRVSQDERQMHQERLAVLGEVAAVVAHELNNPLAAIRMFAQMAASKLPPDSPLLEDVAVIERNTHTCSRTIRELLDYATGAGPEVDSVDVHATLEDVSRFLRAMRERKDVALTLELEAADPVVVGDEVQLRQVFVNLVMNALQAAGDRGGRVTVRTRLDGAHLIVEVLDDGPGIPPEVAERVFRPFYTTKPRGTGTGLGLPTARRIAEIQGGGLELVDGRPGHTTFSVRLLRGSA